MLRRLAHTSARVARSSSAASTAAGRLQRTRRTLATTTRQAHQHARTRGSGAWGTVAAAAGAAVLFASTVEASSASSSPSPEAILACHAELAALLGERFSVDSTDLSSHSEDAFSYHKTSDGATALSGVAFALTTEEVSQIVKICARHRVKMIPYGSGTSLEGHTSAPYGGVCVNLSRMQAIKQLNKADMDVVVEAGLAWGNLNLELKPHGLFFPVDPGPGASIGGMVGTSCSGTNAVRYGTMKHNVLALTVVMPDGSIVKTANRARKSSAGYDLTRLFIGSEGTLGIVTEITLRLQAIPESIAVASTSFDSIHAAASATQALLQRGVRIGCVELLDDGCMQAVNKYSGMNHSLRPATLFFKFTGSPAGVQEEIDLTRQISRAHGSDSFHFATGESERERLWEARKGALWACMAYRAGCEAWTTDVCVPISRMAECIERTKQDLLELDLDEHGEVITLPAGSSAKRRVNFPSAVVGHVGDGNFHVIMMLDPTSRSELALAAAVNTRMIHRAIAAAGTCTGEHGVGVGKKQYLELEHGKPAMQLMRRIKRALDPEGLMNPGKVFDMEEEAAEADAKGQNSSSSSAASGDQKQQSKPQKAVPQMSCSADGVCELPVHMQQTPTVSRIDLKPIAKPKQPQIGQKLDANLPCCSNEHAHAHA